MAGIFAARAGPRVELLERTPKGGKKILISGGGRCNVLPSRLDPSGFVTASAPHIMRRMLVSFPLEDQRAFFERDLALPLGLEAESGKLFPVSNRAKDVRDGLMVEAHRLGVTFRGDTLVKDIQSLPDGRWRVMLEGAEPIIGGAIVLATGGLSVPETGSDGTGLRLAQTLGHVIHPTYPALTPLTAEPPVHAALAGVTISAHLEAGHGKQRSRTFGGFLFTHRGYSGPAVLDISHVATRARLAQAGRETIRVRWCQLDGAAWDHALQERSGATVAGTLRRQLPARLADRLLEEVAIEGSRALSQLRRDERRVLVEQLTGYPLPWTGDEGYKKAEVTGGGVALDEVHPATLESRRTPGLFLCGEMLDAFGPIGGYNFAWAWATGRAAGLGAAGKE
jgi:predicted Rossmann fold flavoprotein